MHVAREPLDAAESDAAIEDDVVLLDDQRRPVGHIPKSAVHHADTPFHLAFSCYLFDAEGRLLLTRRALSKRTWPGVWTNSCCGHPGRGEPIEDAMRRRCEQELDLRIEHVRCVLPDFAYRLPDPTGVWENEFCPVFTARVHPDSRLRPDPVEVIEYAWIDWSTAVRSMKAIPFLFSPWAVLQVEQLAPLLGPG